MRMFFCSNFSQEYLMRTISCVVLIDKHIVYMVKKCAVMAQMIFFVVLLRVITKVIVDRSFWT